MRVHQSLPRLSWYMSVIFTVILVGVGSFAAVQPVAADPVSPDGKLDLPGFGPIKFSPPTLVDLDNNGDLEILVGTSDGKVVAINRSDVAPHLTQMWSFDTSGPLGGSTAIRAAITAADLDGDGSIEIVAAVGDVDPGEAAAEGLGERFVALLAAERFHDVEEGEPTRAQLLRKRAEGGGRIVVPHVVERAVGGDAVADAVGAEHLGHGIDDPLHAGGVGHVAFVDFGRSSGGADRVGRFLQLVDAASDTAHVGAGVGQCQSNGFAQSARGAGHDRRLSGQIDVQRTRNLVRHLFTHGSLGPALFAGAEWDSFVRGLATIRRRRGRRSGVRSV